MAVIYLPLWQQLQVVNKSTINYTYNKDFTLLSIAIPQTKAFY